MSSRTTHTTVILIRVTACLTPAERDITAIRIHVVLGTNAIHKLHIIVHRPIISLWEALDVMEPNTVISVSQLQRTQQPLMILAIILAIKLVTTVAHHVRLAISPVVLQTIFFE